MPKVTTSTARKDYPEDGIKKGDVYYSWAFFRGPTLRSKTYPRPSQLIGSSKLSAAVAIGEALDDALAAATCPEDVKSALDDAVNSCDDVISEYEEAISNLEDAFQNGCPALDDAQSQLEGLESYRDDLEAAASEVEGLDYNDYEAKPDANPEDGGIDWDDLTEEGQAEMLEAARELAVATFEY